MMQILVVAPQRNEFDHLIDGVCREGCEVDLVKFRSIDGARTREFEMTIAIGGHGKAQFAAQTQYLISHHPDVDLVVCAGAAGSLVEHLSFGDVVVSTGTVEHDYRLRFVRRPPPVHFGHATAIEQLRGLVEASPFPFGVHFGGIASGDEDIVDRQRADELHSETGALCVAWEGSGGARAAALNNIPFLEIRVITDAADDSASMDFQANLAKTIPNIASLLLRWLRNRGRHPNCRSRSRGIEEMFGKSQPPNDSSSDLTSSLNRFAANIAFFCYNLWHCVRYLFVGIDGPFPQLMRQARRVRTCARSRSYVCLPANSAANGQDDASCASELDHHGIVSGINYSFHGRLDEMRIYIRALTPKEVDSLHRQRETK